jgi:hypothetical protein
MEANEAQELQEHAEHAANESSMRPVAFTMSVVAVLVAIVTVLGHATHTTAVLDQNKATDQWNYYQAHKIRAYETQLVTDMLSVVAIADKDGAKKLAKGYADHQQKWAASLKEEQDQAEALETKVEKDEARARYFDLGEVLLEIGLVVTSITLLTRTRAYWFAGLAFSVAGIVSAVLGLLVK